MSYLAHRRTIPMLAFSLILAVAVAACGTSDSTPSPEPATPGPAPSEVDLGDLTDALAGIDSYRISVVAEGEAVYTATVIRSPAPAQSVVIGATRIIVVGTEAWVDGGTGTYMVAPVDMAATLTSSFDPIVLLGAYGAGGNLSGFDDRGIETKNDVLARHLRIDNTTGPSWYALPEGAAIDLWVAEAGYLVSIETSGFPAMQGNMAINVTNVNDPSNRVERP